MENSGDKPWSRPWSTKEMVENASKWSLASDVGLLKHLENFANEILSKSEETNKGLENHLQHLQNISLSLEIAKSKFLSLQNTQFIENRVYEDDETEITQTDDSVQEKKLTESERKDIMRNAVLNGLKMVDKYYDKIEVPASDSEEEDSSASFVLRPKDPYLNRHVPYIIGTEEWHKKWHVGLIESSSESEEDKVSEKYSDTESELDLPVTNRKLDAPDTVSEDSDRLFVPAASSSSVKPQSSDKSSDNEESNSISYKPPMGSNVFAEELAAKLGNVLTGNENVNNYNIPEPEINRRPIQKPVNHNIAGFFNDEPPPFEENLPDVHQATDSHGIFSGGTGLFDDEDDSDLFWNKSSVVKKQTEVKKEVEAPSKNLFDDDDNDIFAKPKEIKQVQSHSNDTSIETNMPVKTIKPIGGVAIVPNIFSDKDLKQIKKRHISSDSSEDENDSLFSASKVVTEPKTKEIDTTDNKPKQPHIITTPPTLVKTPPISKTETVKPETKAASLFDDDDTDLFSSDNLFSTTSSKKFFSDIFEDNNLSDNFTDQISKTEQNHISKSTHYSSTNEEPPLIDNDKPNVLASEPPLLSEIKTSKIDTIFNSDDDNFNDDLFSQPPSFTQINKSKSEHKGSTAPSIRDNHRKQEQNHLDKNENLSKDDSSKDVNDFASLIQSTVQKVHNDFMNDDLFEEPPPLPSSNVKNAHPIGHNDLDFDDWDTKSNDYDIFFDSANSNFKKTSIFDNEPPSLMPKSHQGIPKKIEPEPPNKKSNLAPDVAHGTLKESLPKTDSFEDIFQDPSIKHSKQEDSTKKINPPGKILMKEEESTKIPDKISIKEESTNISDEKAESPIPKPSVAAKPEEVVPPKKETKNPPGKLKHNLNINVNALLPGIRPPIKKDINKTNKEENNVNSSITSPKENDTKIQNVINSENKIPSNVSNLDNNVEVLQSITKDRAKPLNRRPSTRRARQEQLRKSGIDFNYNTPEEEENVTVPKTNVNNSIKPLASEKSNMVDDNKTQSQQKSDNNVIAKEISSKEETPSTLVKKEITYESKSNPATGPILKTVTFEELFGDDPEPGFTSSSKKTTSNSNITKIISNEPEYKPTKSEHKNETLKKPNKSLFDDEDSDEDLFPSLSNTMKLPSKSPVENQAKEAINVTIPKLQTSHASKSKKADLFDEDADSDDFFCTKPLPVKPKNVVKASLFDDESEEDDIFGGKAAPRRNHETRDKQTGSQQKKVVKTSTVKKFDGGIVKDPLDAFRN